MHVTDDVQVRVIWRVGGLAILNHLFRVPSFANMRSLVLLCIGGVFVDAVVDELCSQQLARVPEL